MDRLKRRYRMANASLLHFREVWGALIECGAFMPFRGAG